MGRLYVRVVVESEETELVAVVGRDPEVERVPPVGTARRLDTADELLNQHLMDECERTATLDTAADAGSSESAAPASILARNEWPRT